MKLKISKKTFNDWEKAYKATVITEIMTNFVTE